jgi:hypothetical protein
VAFAVKTSATAESAYASNHRAPAQAWTGGFPAGRHLTKVHDFFRGIESLSHRGLGFVEAEATSIGGSSPESSTGLKAMAAVSTVVIANGVGANGQ